MFESKPFMDDRDVSETARTAWDPGKPWSLKTL